MDPKTAFVTSALLIVLYFLALLVGEVIRRQRSPEVSTQKSKKVDWSIIIAASLAALVALTGFLTGKTSTLIGGVVLLFICWLIQRLQSGPKKS